MADMIILTDGATAANGSRYVNLENPADVWTFVGVAILIACAIYISWRERVRHVEPIRDFEQP